MDPSRRWSVEQHVRADAESIFVPLDELAGATVGDTVDVDAPGGEGPARLGRITEQVSDANRGEFFIVRIVDAPDPDPGS
jgi:hypothetical protein